MDPMVLFGSKEAIRTEAAAILKAFGPGPGHVFNLGHGVSQHTSPESVAELVAAVHELSGGANC
jgi:uroporphyrinogen decarboxylase